MDSTLSGARVLVTGAAGFVGAHLCARLEALGAEAHGTSREARPGGAARWHQARLGDGSLAALTRALRPDVVFHLAARVDRGRRAELLAPMLVDNAVEVASLCEALLATSRGRLVLLGSAEEYGADPGPWVEGQRLRPSSPYGLSKAAAWMAAEVAHRTFGLPAFGARTSVLYGPGQRGDQFIPSLIAACIAGERFPMTPGEQTRDFLYIDDLIDGLIAIGTSDREGQLFNLCTGAPVAIATVAREVQRLVGSGHVDVGALPYRGAEAMEQSMSPAAAERELGWRARVGLDEGLRRTIEAARRALSGGR